MVDPKEQHNEPNNNLLHRCLLLVAASADAENIWTKPNGQSIESATGCSSESDSNEPDWRVARSSFRVPHS